MKYVVKNDFGAYVTPHSNGKEWYNVFTDIPNAYKFNKENLKVFKKQFRNDWYNNNWKIFEVIEIEKRCFSL